MATKTRTPKTDETKAAPAVTAQMFTLTGKAPRAQSTPQLGGVKSGLGHQWAKAAQPAPNSRAVAMETLAKLGAEFTMETALKALSALPKGTLGSGSARSYWAAFVASGYIKAK